MQVKGLRNEGVASQARARRDQDLAEARRWIFAEWPGSDWDDILHAIRDGVASECLLRDEREHQIPLSGKIYEDGVTLDPATGKPKLPPIRVDPRRMGLRHGNREVRLETRRRFHALTMLRPEPSTFFDLQRAIIDDDGKDAEGRWLCGRCIPHPDHTLADRKHEAWPDGTGFDERLPKWVPNAVEKSAPAPPQPPPNETTTQGPRPGVFADGCSECHGAKYGKGYRHADGCTKSTVRPKATA